MSELLDDAMEQRKGALTLSITEDQELIQQADVGIRAHLDQQRDQGRITGRYYDDGVANAVPNLRKWLLADELDRISPGLRDGLRNAIREHQWEALANAYARDVAFGTGGIREKMGSERDVILRLKNEGIHASIIKGPNTINDVIYLLTSAGVAKFGIERKPPLSKVVIGLDSRIRGADFARLIAGLFLAYDYTVYLFDEACLYPSVTYAVPTLKADIGVFISASHNDFRYNGYKLSCQNGSQFDPAERDKLYRDYITKVKFTDIKTMSLTDAPTDKLWFLGGVKGKGRRVVQEGEHNGLPLADPLPDARDLYAGREHRIIDVHTMHVNHVKTFLLRPAMITEAKRPLSIGYSAFNGSGRKAVPRLLREVGFENVRRIMKLDPLDGMFPAFCSDPGKEQQPDPGDWRAADVAVAAYKEEYGSEWDNVDLIIGTDPDADRCATIAKVPEHQREAYPHLGTGEPRDYILLSADEVWSLLLRYRLEYEIERFGAVKDAGKKFITMSHTTTDLLTCIARKYGLGLLRTWVGFAQLAAATRAIWDLRRGRDTDGLTEGGKLPHYDEGRRNADDAMSNRTIHSWEAMDDTRRCINIGALEQSNGFSILGNVPRDDRSLGVDGHVRDKDGTIAAVLVAELAAYAKEQGTNLLDLADEKLYLDPDIGLYVTHYEPDPLDGEYEGLAGYTKKRGILNKAEKLYAKCGTAKCGTGFQPVKRTGRKPVPHLLLGGMAVKSATVYRTGKYDAINWKGFPDEGYRFYFDDKRKSHLTIRPSGTSNALRFHVQLFGGHPSREELIPRKAQLRATTVQIVKEIRAMIGADS
ncbi:MAG: phosphohexomutase domain-containing protein [Planctomycetota bacterium]